MKTVAERLRFAMTIRGLDPDVRGNTRAFQQLAGLSAGYGYRILQGDRRELTSGVARRIADALAIDLGWLVSGGGKQPMEDAAQTARIRSGRHNVGNRTGAKPLSRSAYEYETTTGLAGLSLGQRLARRADRPNPPDGDGWELMRVNTTDGERSNDGWIYYVVVWTWRREKKGE